MKAVVYTKYGSPEVLQLKEIEKPVPKSDEILIRIHAAEATKADCELRSFNFQVKWFWLPLRIAMGPIKPKKSVLGGYFSGEVESTGKEITKFKAGDQVFGSAGFRLGAYAEYVCLPGSYTIVPKPKNMTFEEAAAVPLGGLNALHFIRKANIKSGERVLINGAGGSIGTFAVQIAKGMGAEVTVGLGSHDSQVLQLINNEAHLLFDSNSNQYSETSAYKAIDVWGHTAYIATFYGMLTYDFEIGDTTWVNLNDLLNDFLYIWEIEVNAPNDIFIGGDGGRMMHFNGYRWIKDFRVGASFLIGGHIPGTMGIDYNDGMIVSAGTVWGAHAFIARGYRQ